jgi:plasmid maintenance system antidote protein VapI
MTDQEIKDLFDENLDMTLDELSRITGRTRKELKNILMGG